MGYLTEEIQYLSVREVKQPIDGINHFHYCIAAIFLEAVNTVFVVRVDVDAMRKKCCFDNSLFCLR